VSRWILAYLAAGLVFIAGDFTWISLTGPVIYRPVLGPLLADRIDLGAAIAFYLVYFIGVLAFGVAPGLRSGSWMKSLGSGALFGLVAYATYDLTNQATLKTWSATITVSDMAWGAFITGIASAVGCRAAMIIR
jgi:uncharacterized membrane protein